MRKQKVLSFNYTFTVVFAISPFILVYFAFVLSRRARVHARLSKSEILHLTYATKNNSQAFTSLDKFFTCIAKWNAAGAKRRDERTCALPKILPNVSRRVTRTTRIFINTPTLRRAPSRARILFLPPRATKCVCGDLKLGWYVSHVPICRSITTLVECLDKDSSANCSGG